MKRFTAMLLASLLCLTLCVPAVAADEKNEEKIVYTYTVPEEAIDAEYEERMAEIINEIKASRTTRGGDDYIYVPEVVQKVYAPSVGGFAGNQLPGGYRFLTGADFIGQIPEVRQVLLLLRLAEQ